MSASNGGSIRGRIPLLAGSAAAAILGGLVLAPTSAVAQATCVATPTPTGDGTTAVTIAAGTYNPGIACTYGATSATVSTLGAITVGSTAGGTGVDLTAAGSNAITWVSTAGGVTGGAQNVGPVIDATSVSGPINITVGAITGTTIQNTYGVQAVSTGGGAVSVTNTTGAINVNSGAVGAQQLSAIRAVSTGGAGAVTVSTSTGGVTGRRRGIEAQSSGTGALTITALGSVSVNTAAGVGIAAIDARTGAGLLIINVPKSNQSTIDGGGGAAILTNAGGDAVISIGEQRSVTAGATSTATLDLTAVGSTTLNLLDASVRASSSNRVVIRASGGSFTLNSSKGETVTSPQINGRMDLSGVTGAVTINNNDRSTWVTIGVSNLGPGDSTLNNVVGGTLKVATATFNELETLNNGGTIQFGEFLSENRAFTYLSSPDTDFIGSGLSRLRIEAELGVAGQADCAVAVLVADCLSLAGGTTSGLTTILVVARGDVSADANTAGITLVDVAGGESHAGDFVLDVDSTNYAQDPVYGAVLTTPGWLGFALHYDDANQRHYLASVVPTQKLEYVAALQEVMSIWTSTSDTIAGRQADLRDRGDPGAWLRVTGERTTRDVSVAYAAGDVDYDYDDEYEMQTTTAIGGLDLLGGDNFVFGIHGGGIKSELERASSPTVDKIDGVTAGLYGGWWSDAGLSLDGTINANFLNIVHERPTEEVSDTSVISTGVRAEAGWRMTLGESFYVQPLATAAYVHAEMKDIIQTGFTAGYEDIESLRAALGLRAGGDLATGGATLGYWVTGRVWKEFSGEGSLILATTAEDVTFHDDLVGDFQEVGAGLSLSNAADTLEGYVSGGAKFADGADNYSASFGLRLRW